MNYYTSGVKQMYKTETKRAQLNANVVFVSVSALQDQIKRKFIFLISEMPIFNVYTEKN